MPRKPPRAWVAIAAAALALGQQKTPEPGTVFHAPAHLVVCNATVVDRNGRPLTDLRQSAFTVYENDVAQTISLFRHEDVPVSLGLVIDNSTSMRDKRVKVNTAAMDLIRASNPEDEVFVVNFNEKAYLDLPNGKDFTNDPDEMEAALGLVEADGETALRDAIRVSIDHLQKRAHHDKKVLVVLSDGEDNASTVSADELVRAAQQSGVLIYAVGLLDIVDPLTGAVSHSLPNARRARAAMQGLSEATGGDNFFPDTMQDVDHIAWQVARVIRSQYTIGYTPSNPVMDSTYRAIRITVNAPGRPVVRTRSGYFATPDRYQD